jgi:hypothetical protein
MTLGNIRKQTTFRNTICVEFYGKRVGPFLHSVKVYSILIFVVTFFILFCIGFILIWKWVWNGEWHIFVICHALLEETKWFEEMKIIWPLVCSTRTTACTNMYQSNIQASQLSLFVSVYTATLWRLCPELSNLVPMRLQVKNSTNQINRLHLTKTRKLCHSVTLQKFAWR